MSPLERGRGVLWVRGLLITYMVERKTQDTRPTRKTFGYTISDHTSGIKKKRNPRGKESQCSHPPLRRKMAAVKVSTPDV